MSSQRKPRETPAPSPEPTPPPPEPVDEPEPEREATVGRHAARSLGAQLAETAAREQAEAELEPEPEPEPEPESELDPTTAAVAKANGTYIRAVVKALGPENPIAPCPHCSGLGFNSLEVAPDQHRQRCDECGGRGMVATGSLVEGQHVLGCESCHGNGWTRKLDVPAAQQTLAPVVPVLPAYTPPLEQQPIGQVG